ncbi:hypothetical protein ACIQSO_14615 [Pseudomonas putida]|uniref:hypothetical protein n=1 Tax=Pseudomonas putida TaxID=303 RepID=UPI00383A9CF7
MVGITSVNVAALNTQPSALQTAARSSDTDQVTESTRDNQVAMPAEAGKSDKAKGGENSSEPSHIKQMRELIKELQKQLVEAQKRLAEIEAQPMDEKAKLAAVAGAQAQVTTISGQIQQATAQLLQALSKMNSGSSGNIISTRA